MSVLTVPAGRRVCGVPGDRLGFCMAAWACFLAKSFNAFPACGFAGLFFGSDLLYSAANFPAISAESFADPRLDDPNFPFDGIMTIDHPSGMEKG
jgi:hypothetical protein